ncbi:MULTISPECIES: NAD-dependent epimerase/dehydratase family protein [unclassified Fibrobacter]|uniref:NAD-dependent epimerase/dehydratase family protein n=1 Tax=unclassified Fibrobacter TaxID=2634177 RepID=UPI000D6C0350|nr:MULTISPECIES: NAD-dependent epimerase/dehydratase family protein [unclassified Fibrobacter]PWJ61048.1 UDP-glucuronate 4-epimerase [Fibrobacter sp. UWR4]PZW68069.1 UDP-glucuronate 4-epimerase [Fibrobacter sp. UWR1]
MKILVTGAAGFIGSKLMYMLAERGDTVVGVDNINDYYDVRLKYGRLRECGIEYHNAEIPFGTEIQSSKFENCRFIRLSIDDKASLDELFQKENFDKVVNLAAQAGVRYSITNPYAYMQSNLVGFLNILEACRHFKTKHLIFASSSSVYGLNTKVPYNETDKVDSPVSLYAASKKSNELMAHSYSKLYNLPVTGLRFFTVYGPWGRPDMSPMLFAKAISKGEPIKVFNNGDMIRDFTYIDDIVEGTIHVVDRTPDAAACENNVAYKIYNIGCSHPVKLMDFISEIENAYGEPAKKEFLPMQPGDVYQTNADTTRLETECGYKPHWSLHDGISQFMQWYKSDKNPLK